ncbi:MAG TPA: glycosyltransferase family 2 protein [Chitinophagaceae bacterium]|nr:glycosyltransferase family 2 protein [Chitinophagaceae bacterium]
MSQPLFTVVTITYNSAPWVRQAIESVLASSFTDFEYIISDDCSTDNTWYIIQQYKDPRIKAWRNEVNIGEYPNRNKALKVANGRYILYIDGDDILYKHTLRNLCEYIKAFPEIVMIWGVSPEDVDYAVLPYAFNPNVTMRLIYETPFLYSSIGFSETLFSISGLKRVGFFSEKYNIGDTYIKKRLALEGDVLFVPKGFSFWRRSEEQATRKVSKSYIGFIEGYKIDLEILAISELPNKQDLVKKVKGSFLRRLIIYTILRGKFLIFFKLLRLSGITFSDLKYFFLKYDVSFKPVQSISQPIFNRYNFD